MPRYATVDRLQDTYPWIAKVESVSSAQLALAIESEEALVDGVLSKRYAIPVSPTPPLVATAVIDLAVLRVIQTRMRDRGTADDNLSKTLSRSWLLIQDVANGKIGLPDADGSLIEPIAGAELTLGQHFAHPLVMDEGPWERMHQPNIGTSP